MIKCFGYFIVVDYIFFWVNCGEIFGFFGVNGVGKIIVMCMFCGLSKFILGMVWVVGFDVVVYFEEVKKNIGYMS